MRIINSNNVVFKWSNDRNIGNRDKMLRLCCGKIWLKSNFTQHCTTSSNIVQHAIWEVVKRMQHWLQTILDYVATKCCVRLTKVMPERIKYVTMSGLDAFQRFKVLYLHTNVRGCEQNTATASEACLPRPCTNDVKWRISHALISYEY